MDISYFLLLSCVGLFTSAQAQNCSRPVLGENMDLRGNNILLQSFADGAKVSLSCNFGYQAARGKTSITCTAGSWSPVTLICEKKSCGSAGEVLNGDVQYPTGNEFGDKAIIVCNTGYRLVGQGERLCGAIDWEGRLPRCEVVTCDAPPAIVDGTQDPVKDVYEYRDVVEYSCNRGLSLIGPSSISCSANEQFNSSPPQCKKVECPDYEIVNGEWVGGSRPPHVYQATMTFKCNSGFKIKGQATIKCGSDNSWSPELPQCEAVTCARPSNVDHGSFSPDKSIYQYDDVVKYSCDAGFKMTGTNSQSCSQSGTFTSVSPTCTMVTCARPSNVDHGSFSPDKSIYQYDDVVKYSCDAGFKMTGSDSQSCSQSGTFTSFSPTCTMVTCARPSNVDHGSFSPDKSIYQYDDVVKYSCDAGYEMTGSDSQSCSQSGTFTSVPPTCTSKTTTGRPTTTTTTINVAPPKNEENSGNHVKIIVGMFVGLLVILVICFCGYCYLKKTKSSSVNQRDGEKVTDDEVGHILWHPSES
ncbi:zona pellucida sperm-binding protein 3 receptor-like isoform X4 [Nelusetta ayraudi]|uniref:zona pellucida sperm-binding protein 3 receptor-like isoform X4 n=1 Tax=Nelusetta ayraudi TaxID=303726 RepID=UPI003F706C9B